MKTKSSKWLGLVAVVCAGTAFAEPNWLVSPDEVKQDAAWVGKHGAPVAYRTRAFAPGVPEISVVSPASVSEPLKAPFPIKVTFKAKEGATIKPDSFRALYGFLKVDITDRLAGRAKVGPEGLTVESADIPAGNHRLMLRVSDDRDRQAETEIRFSVQ